MFKKISVILVVVSMIFTIAGCNKNGGLNSSGNTNSNAAGSSSVASTLESSVPTDSTPATGRVNTGSSSSTATTGTDSAVNNFNLTIQPVDQLLSHTPAAALTCSSYDLLKFTKLFYKSQIQYNEVVFLRYNADGSLNPAPLLFKPAKILEVRSNDLKTLYNAGTDYTLTSDDKIAIPAGSRITPMNYTDYFEPTKVSSDYGWFYDLDGAKIYTTNNIPLMYSAKIVVTYITTEPYTGYETMDKSKLLTNLTNKLAAPKNKPINVLFVGDSITAGAGGSGNFETWREMVTDGIQSYTNGKVTDIDGAIPGANTVDYINLINNNLGSVSAGIMPGAVDTFNTASAAAPTADVVVIGFGTNDAGGWMRSGSGLSAADYSTNIKKIIDFFRSKNPNCSIVLVAGIQPNTNVYTNATTKLVGIDMELYANALGAIETSRTYANAKNLAYVDVYRMQQSILTVKQPQETLLGDNMNHPDDYMARIYAQTILGTILHNY